MPIHMRFNEDDLRRDINGLDHQIEEASKPNDATSRRVTSYLKQVLKHKRDKLATLRYRKYHQR